MLGARLQHRANLDGLDAEVVEATSPTRRRCGAALEGCAASSTSPPTTGCGPATRRRSCATTWTGRAAVMARGPGRGRRADRLHLQRRHPGQPGATAAPPTRPARPRRSRRSAPTSAPRSWPSGWWSALVAERGLPAVIVNPSTPIGPRDVKPTPTGRIIVEAATGKIPAFVDTGLNLVHVDDVAAGHLLAMDKGRDRRALHPGRRGREPAADAGRDRRPGRAQGADRRTCRAARSIRWRWRSRPSAQLTGKEPMLTVRRAEHEPAT